MFSYRGGSKTDRINSQEFGTERVYRDWTVLTFRFSEAMAQEGQVEIRLPKLEIAGLGLLP